MNRYLKHATNIHLHDYKNIFFKQRKKRNTIHFYVNLTSGLLDNIFVFELIFEITKKQNFFNFLNYAACYHIQ